MKAIYLILISALILFSCKSEQNQDVNAEDVQKSEAHIGKVIDKIPAKGYTYLQVSENKNDYWIAVPTYGNRNWRNCLFFEIYGDGRFQ